jgi:hypothetical protein
MWKCWLVEAEGSVLRYFHCNDESLPCLSLLQKVSCSVKFLILVNSAPKSWLVVTNQTIKFLVCDVCVCACLRFQKQQGTGSEMGDRRSDYVSCAAPQSLPTAVRAEQKGSQTLVHERFKWTRTVTSYRKAF